MYTKLIGHILEKTRPELIGAALVVIYGGSYLAAYFALQLFARMISWDININFYMLNIFIGCIGFGELARGLAKLLLGRDNWKWSLFTTTIAGSVSIGMFWVLMVFKWSHNSFKEVPLAALSGAIFYLVLAGLFMLENRKNSNKTLQDDR